MGTNNESELPTMRSTSSDSVQKGSPINRTPTWHGYAFRKRKMRIQTFAKYCPLVSAILAPLATLLDIPALTQHWYAQNGTPQPDPEACLILSAIGLALNILANILLIVRFSSKSPWWWRHSTRWSLIFWVGKTIVAVVNLIIFGILSRNEAGYSYLEGFWCAVISVIDAGIISITLLFHYFFAFGKEEHDQSDIRSEGRRFMLSVTTFISILAVQSLVFAKIEGWSYSDGIYFSTQVALTIGYGDFVPTKTATKILVFPFSVLTISQLGNEIALIIGFISSRAEHRREKWRKKYEGAMHQEANKMRPRAGLIAEMSLIHKISQREDLTSQMYDLLWSLLSLLVFWAIGATLFSQIEGWPWGDAVYVVMILSLTIGFGDFTPKQPAGRVVFIVYALMAVPVITSFAVQTVTGLLSTYSERGAAREAFLAEQRRSPEAFAPHAEVVLKYHETYDQARKSLLKGDAASTDHDSEQDEEKDHTKGDGSGTSIDRSEEHLEKSQISSSTSESDNEEDLSGNTMTGKKRHAGHRGHGRLGSADKALRKDYAHARDTIEHREDEAKKWEKVKIEHENHDDDISESDQKDQSTQSSPGKGKSSKRSPKNRDMIKEEVDDDTDEPEERNLEIDLLKQLMRKTIQLEAEARQMLLDSMDKSVARTLLLADRNVQARDVRALKGDDKDIMAIWQDESNKNKSSKREASEAIDEDDQNGTAQSKTQTKGELDLVTRVNRYRNTFAEVLVIGSVLQHLEGEEKERFERWREFRVEQAEDREQDRTKGKERVNQENEADLEAKDINDVADKKWDGLSSRLAKRWVRKVRKEEWSKWDTV
ncbi:uncharacterized protein IL334_004292 [Kwoniella shivajii]|uniref:Potassium channel domain-containing protein n=1 Tax=Kwoniella shivajii TaxID=564305 RepID=A0ABZ1D168_9TREE|nr:hypothetical protein IL334_004292 [Kwoniella shivajii]